MNIMFYMQQLYMSRCEGSVVDKISSRIFVTLRVWERKRVDG